MGGLESRDTGPHGSLGLHVKDKRWLKLEVKTPEPEKFIADLRMTDGIDKISAAVYVGGVKRTLSAFSPPRDGNKGRGSGGPEARATSRVVFKELPIRSGKVKQKKHGEFVIKGEDDAGCKCLRKLQNPEGEHVVTRGSSKEEALKNFICGGFAGIVSRTAVAPLDLIKTHLITSHGASGCHKSALDIFMEIWRTEGWRGLFRGNGINCIRVAPCKAIELCGFEAVKKILGEEGHPLQQFSVPLAGGVAGMAGTLATYPLELIRTRISLQPKEYSGLVEAVSKISKEEGFSALYAGLTPSLLGVFPYAATNYYVYDSLRSSYCRATGKRHVPTGLTLLFGAVAAAASSAVTYPLEVARRQMQLGAAAMVSRRGTIDLVSQIYREEGFLALYRGLGTSWLKLVPAAGISFVCYEATRRAWEIEREKRERVHKQQS